MTRPGSPAGGLEGIVAGLVEQIERRFFGKYRGRVVDNEDPAGLGRLKVTVPSVFGPDLVTGWATPCAPYGGAAGQGLFLVPEREAGVWIEFEEGDLEFPIWVGTYWTMPGDESQIPHASSFDGSTADAPQTVPTAKIFKTLRGHTVQFEDADDDTAGIVLVDGSNGHVIALNKDGVAVTDGFGNEIALTGDGIRLTDLTGNELVLSKDAVTLTAKKALTIDAAGQDVEITAKTINMVKG